MVSDFQTQESYQFFTEEAVELLQELEQGLLSLRENNNTATINTLMRIAHSLKGGSACVGLDDIQKIAGHLEHIFQIIKCEDLDVELEDLLLKAYECLRSPLLEEIETSNSDSKASIEMIQSISAQIETKFNSKSEKKADVTDFLFAEEVAEGIDRLEMILQNADRIDKLEGLKAQLEIFKGLGKIAQLDGFISIAETTLSALKANPDSLQRIGELALEDFRRARTNILAGNRTLVASLSPALIDLASVRTPVDNSLPAADPSLNKITENTDLVADRSESKVIEIEQPTSEEEDRDNDLSVTNLASLRLGVRMDLDRLKLLNNLVAELVTQDNRYLLEHKQQVESIEVIKNLYDRFKHINHNLYSCLHQLNLNQQKNNKITSCFLDGSGNQNSKKLGTKKCSYPKLDDLMENVTEELAHLGECIQDR